VHPILRFPEIETGNQLSSRGYSIEQADLPNAVRVLAGRRWRESRHAKGPTTGETALERRALRTEIGERSDD